MFQNAKNECPQQHEILLETCGLLPDSHTCELKDDDNKTRRTHGMVGPRMREKRHRIFPDAADDVNKRRQSRAKGIESAGTAANDNYSALLSR